MISLKDREQTTIVFDDFINLSDKDMSKINDYIISGVNLVLPFG